MLTPTDAPDLHAQRFPSRRSAVMGTGGMVATSQPLAAAVGLRAIQDGGNAADAAVATAAALAVVEPTGSGMGGDAFALWYDAQTGDVRALNGSGRSPRAMTRQALEARSLDDLPQRGPLPVTVPGAVDAWITTVETLGRLPLARVLAPAITLAEDGYPVSELIARAWGHSAALLSGHAGARRHLLPGGRAPRPGQLVRLPAMARALRAVADGGRAAFYEGPIADDIVATITEAGGFMTHDDLRDHHTEWVTPLSTTYRGARIWECPPNGQGLAALIALAVARGLDLSGPPWRDPRTLHLLVEAMRLGSVEADAWVADPAHTTLPLDELLSETHAADLRARIHPDRAIDPLPPPLDVGTDTVYLAVVDAAGNACSFIASNYMGFGSGLATETYGIPLQNRGAGFRLAPDHPNSYAPGKRPYHTIIPALATRTVDDSLLACFGVMGGHMQPQGHLQVVSHLVDDRLDPQRALDAPRFQLRPDGRLALEPGFAPGTHHALTQRGHDVLPPAATPPAGTFGGGQVIAVDEHGVRIGGSDPRKDGGVVVEVVGVRG